HAIERMKQYDYNFAPVLDGKAFAGLLRLSAAEEAVRAGLRDISSKVEEARTVSADTNLDEVLTHMLQSTAPVVVTGDNDEFVGLMSRTKVVELVSPAIDGSNGDSNDEADSNAQAPQTAPATPTQAAAVPAGAAAERDDAPEPPEGAIELDSSLKNKPEKAPGHTH